MNNYDLLSKKLDEIFDLMRYIFEDDVDITKLLSNEYKLKLSKKLNRIPNSYTPKVLEVVDMTYEAIGCINIVMLLDFFNKYNINVQFNSFKFVNKILDMNKDISNAVRIVVSSLLTDLQNVFICIDKIVDKPSLYLSKIIKRTKKSDDILGQL